MTIILTKKQYRLYNHIRTFYPSGALPSRKDLAVELNYRRVQNLSHEIYCLKKLGLLAYNHKTRNYQFVPSEVKVVEKKTKKKKKKVDEIFIYRNSKSKIRVQKPVNGTFTPVFYRHGYWQAEKLIPQY